MPVGDCPQRMGRKAVSRGVVSKDYVIEHVENGLDVVHIVVMPE